MCTAIIQILSNFVHWNTQAMPKIQVVNFLYVTLLTRLFLKLLQVFWIICGPRPQCVRVIQFSEETESSMQSLMVC
jgi:hypothetical protein